MQVNLPQDVIDRAKQYSQSGDANDLGDVLRKALDAMERADRELHAIQQGLKDHKAGNYSLWDDFVNEIKANPGATPHQ